MIDKDKERKEKIIFQNQLKNNFLRQKKNSPRFLKIVLFPWITPFKYLVVQLFLHLIFQYRNNFIFKYLKYVSRFPSLPHCLRFPESRIFLKHLENQEMWKLILVFLYGYLVTTPGSNEFPWLKTKLPQKKILFVFVCFSMFQIWKTQFLHSTF